MPNVKKSNKVLVRNPSVSVKTGKKREEPQTSKKVHFSDELLPQQKTAFAAPEFCSVRQIAEEVKAIRRTLLSSRSVPEFAKHRNVDFPLEEKLYQDLIDLEISEKPPTEVRSQPCIRLKRDPEIDVNMYKKYSLEPEYFFTYDVEHFIKTLKPGFDGKSIYKKLIQWKAQND